MACALRRGASSSLGYAAVKKRSMRREIRKGFRRMRRLILREFRTLDPFLEDAESHRDWVEKMIRSLENRNVNR